MSPSGTFDNGWRHFWLSCLGCVPGTWWTETQMLLDRCTGQSL